MDSIAAAPEPPDPAELIATIDTTAPVIAGSKLSTAIAPRIENTIKHSTADRAIHLPPPTGNKQGHIGVANDGTTARIGLQTPLPALTTQGGADSLSSSWSPLSAGAC